MKRVRLAGIIQFEDGFAFMHRTNVQNKTPSDYYTFPGGGLEENETLEEGTKREIEEEFGIKVEVIEQLYYFENEIAQEHFYLCKYSSGEFATGKGPEFSGDPKYAHKGNYIPEIIKKENVKNILLLPDNIAEIFVKDIENGRFDK